MENSLGQKYKPYLIAEIGINHNGDLQNAKKLIDCASAAKWDCVKFQKRNPDVCVPEDQKNIMRDTPWGRMTYLEYKKKIEFGKEEYDYIAEYCKEKPIDWTVSVWDHDSLEFILNYDVPFIKIPSAMVTNLDLISSCSKQSKHIILSTGMSDLSEIDAAVKILKDNSADFSLMHCNSTYPANESDLNLRVINTLEERYNCSVGYSGHEYSLRPTTIAAYLGATSIERHITLDHNMWGTDQSCSLELHAMVLLEKRLRNLSEIIGDGKKVITPDEANIRKKLSGN